MEIITRIAEPLFRVDDVAGYRCHVRLTAVECFPKAHVAGQKEMVRQAVEIRRRVKSALAGRASHARDTRTQTREARKQLLSQRHAVRLQQSYAPKPTATLTSLCRNVFRASEERHGYRGGASGGRTPSSHQQHLNE